MLINSNCFLINVLRRTGGQAPRTPPPSPRSGFTAGSSCGRGRDSEEVLGEGMCGSAGARGGGGGAAAATAAELVQLRQYTEGCSGARERGDGGGKQRGGGLPRATGRGAHGGRASKAIPNRNFALPFGAPFPPKAPWVRLWYVYVPWYVYGPTFAEGPLNRNAPETEKKSPDLYCGISPSQAEVKPRTDLPLSLAKARSRRTKGGCVCGQLEPGAETPGRGIACSILSPLASCSGVFVTKLTDYFAPRAARALTCFLQVYTLEVFTDVPCAIYFYISNL